MKPVKQLDVERRVRDTYETVAADTQSRLPPVAFLSIEPRAVAHPARVHPPAKRRARTTALAFVSVVLLIAAVVAVDRTSRNQEPARTATTATSAANQVRELKQVLDLPNVLDTDRVIGTVVSQPDGQRSRMFRFSKGSGDGIAPGMPVIVGAGKQAALVGRVVSATTHSAQIRRIDDPRFGVGARLLTRRGVQVAAGTVTGQRDGSLLFTPVDVTGGSQSLQKGDPAVTAGFVGERVPPDLIIGTVTKGNQTPATRTTFTVHMRPVVDLNTLEFVAVLK